VEPVTLAASSSQEGEDARQWPSARQWLSTPDVLMYSR
jgi:hypothetical protein